MPEPSSPGRAAPDHLILIGMMGAGKTTVGALVAARLGRPALDTDAQVCALTGRSVAEIFALDGEAAFRSEEAKVIQAALASDVPSVISVGGGAVLDPSTRWLLGRGGPVVWLRAEPATLVDRLGTELDRPLLTAQPGQSLAERVQRIDQARRPIYAGLADLAVDVEGRDAAEVAELVLDGLGLRMPIR